MAELHDFFFSGRGKYGKIFVTIGDLSVLMKENWRKSAVSYQEEFQFWLEDDYFDAATKEELLAIRNNTAEVEDRFYRELEFGTGGLRGVVAAGTNRMNVYTVRKATQGLANYILKQGTQAKGVAISFDNRRMSTEFAQETALCAIPASVPR